MSAPHAAREGRVQQHRCLRAVRARGELDWGSDCPVADGRMAFLTVCARNARRARIACRAPVCVCVGFLRCRERDGTNQTMRRCGAGGVGGYALCGALRVGPHCRGVHGCCVVTV